MQRWERRWCCCCFAVVEAEAEAGSARCVDVYVVSCVQYASSRGRCLDDTAGLVLLVRVLRHTRTDRQLNGTHCTVAIADILSVSVQASTVTNVTPSLSHQPTGHQSKRTQLRLLARRVDDRAVQLAPSPPFPALCADIIRRNLQQPAACLCSPVSCCSLPARQTGTMALCAALRSLSCQQSELRSCSSRAH